MDALLSHGTSMKVSPVVAHVFKISGKKTSAKSKSASFIHFVFHVIVIQTF